MTMNAAENIKVMLGSFVLLASLWAGFLVPNVFANEAVQESFAAGDRDDSFEVGEGFNAVVYSVAIQEDQKILVGGAFTQYQGELSSRLIRLNSDGSKDNSFATGIGFNEAVNTIAVQSDGKIIVGGKFTEYQSKSANRIIRLHADGSRDESFELKEGFNRDVVDIEIQEEDGKILVGGAFNKYQNEVSNGIVRLNIDGSKDSFFNIGSGFGGNVVSLEIQKDGKIIAGGSFGSYQGGPVNRIIRLNADGSRDFSFNVGSGFNNIVNDIVIQENDEILIGGYFTEYQGKSASKIVRLNSDGSKDDNFDVGSGFRHNRVESIVIQKNGQILIGGDFVLYQRTRARNIIRLNADGSYDKDFDIGIGLNQEIFSLGLQKDGRIIAGGFFSEYQGDSSNRIVRLHGDILEDSKDPSEYPIILVHGIMGAWNPEMFGLDGKSWDLVLGLYRQDFNGKEWIELNEDRNFSDLRSSLPQDSYYQFYYDWRNSNQDSAQELADHIQRVKLITASNKVNVIAHSMGGLVTREYIESDQYREDIEKFIMAGTPNHGATNAIPRWKYGKVGRENVIQWSSLFVRWVLTEWHPYKDSDMEDEDRKAVIQGAFAEDGIPGVKSLKELLPIYPSLRVFTGQAGEGASYFEVIENSSLINLNNNTTNLYGIDTLFIPGVGEQTAREYHIRKDSNDNIVSFGGFNEWTNQGDKTVLVDSVLLDCEDGSGLTETGAECNNEQGGTWQRQDVAYEHNGLPGAACREILLYVGREPDLCDLGKFPSDPEQPVDDSDIPGYFDLLGFSVASPVDISVTTPSGKVFDADQSEEFFQEEGAMYISLGEEGKKLIMIPRKENGEYTVSVTGVEEGGYYEVITWVDTEEQSFDTVESGEIQPGEIKEYTVTIEEDEGGLIQEEVTQPVAVNNPPVAVLDNVKYTGVERQEIVFDASESYDPDGDEIQYKWEIDGEYEGDWTDEVVFRYTFTGAYNGKVRLSVTDDELEDTIEAEISIRTFTYHEKVSYTRELIDSLADDTRFIQSRKRVWLHLVDLLNHPLIEKLPNLKIAIIQTLERDIETSLYLNDRSQSHWLLWRRQTLISKDNIEIIKQIQDQLALMK